MLGKKYLFFKTLKFINDNRKTCKKFAFYNYPKNGGLKTTFKHKNCCLKRDEKRHERNTRMFYTFWVFLEKSTVTTNLNIFDILNLKC